MYCKMYFENKEFSLQLFIEISLLIKTYVIVPTTEHSLPP